MRRRRVHVGRGPLVVLGQLVVVLVALVAIWAGAAVLALALGADAGDVETVSGYRDVHDRLAELDASGLTTVARAAIGAGGLLLAALLARLALAQLPRPHVARADREVSRDALGTVTVTSRAIERAAESAAGGGSAVLGATARLDGNDLVVALRLRDPATLAQTLEVAATRVTDSLERHGLGPYGVRVVAARLDASARREVI